MPAARPCVPASDAAATRASLGVVAPRQRVACRRARRAAVAVDPVDERRTAPRRRSACTVGVSVNEKPSDVSTRRRARPRQALRAAGQRRERRAARRTRARPAPTSRARPRRSAPATQHARQCSRQLRRARPPAAPRRRSAGRRARAASPRRRRGHERALREHRHPADVTAGSSPSTATSRYRSKASVGHASRPRGRVAASSASTPARPRPPSARRGWARPGPAPRARRARARPRSRAAATRAAPSSAAVIPFSPSSDAVFEADRRLGRDQQPGEPGQRAGEQERDDHHALGRHAEQRGRARVLADRAHRPRPRR